MLWSQMYTQKVTCSGTRNSALANRFSTVPSSWRTSPSHGRTCSTTSVGPTSRPCSKIDSLGNKMHAPARACSTP